MEKQHGEDSYKQTLAIRREMLDIRPDMLDIRQETLDTSCYGLLTPNN